MCLDWFMFSTHKIAKTILCGCLYVKVSETQAEYTAEITEIYSEMEHLMTYIR